MAGPARFRLRGSAAALAASLLVGVIAAAPARAGDCASRNPLTSGFMSSWKSKYGASKYQIAVYDMETGCQYTKSDTGRSFPTASTVKLAIAVAVLEDVSAGKYSYASVQRDLTAMITVSDNLATTRLYRKVGRTSGITRVASHYAMTGTRPGRSWGVTKTTALDQVRLVHRALTMANPRITSKNRKRLLTMMRKVRADQHWGAGGGLPAGWTSAVKNGWYPTVPGDEPPVRRWRLNTVGVVYNANGQPQWIMAGYSNTWKTQSQGIRAWNAVSRQLVRRLGQ